MRTILICPHEKLKKKFEAAVAEHRGVVLSKALSEYPNSDVLRRLVRAWAPEVIFIDLEDAGPAEVVNRQLEGEFPGIQRIGVHSSQDPSTFRVALRLHMHEVLIAPFHRAQIDDVIAQAASFRKLNPTLVPVSNHFFAFMPVKPGVGASTLAANTTWAYGRLQKSQVLLADFDLSSGITEFLFKTEHEHRVTDALSRVHELDDEAWQRLVKKLGNIDLLLSGAPCISESIKTEQIHQLIEFMRRNYDIVNADLSDTFDEISLAVLRDADRIVLVTTSELPAVRMAKLKVRLLQDLDLGEKLRLVVNRVRKGTPLDSARIAETVGLPVFASFPCAYSDVARSIHAGTASEALTQSVQLFAEQILEEAEWRQTALHRAL